MLSGLKVTHMAKPSTASGQFCLFIASTALRYQIAAHRSRSAPLGPGASAMEPSNIRRAAGTRNGEDGEQREINQFRARRAPPQSERPDPSILRRSRVGG